MQSRTKSATPPANCDASASLTFETPLCRGLGSALQQVKPGIKVVSCVSVPVLVRHRKLCRLSSFMMRVSECSHRMEPLTFHVTRDACVSGAVRPPRLAPTRQAAPGTCCISLRSVPMMPSMLLVPERIAPPPYAIPLTATRSLHFCNVAMPASNAACEYGCTLPWRSITAALCT